MERRLYTISERGNQFSFDIDNFDIIPFDIHGKNDDNLTSDCMLWSEADCQIKPLRNLHLHRVTVCVSNDCNLRCKYCYAQGGNYGLSRSLMTKAEAIKFVDFCCKYYDRIDNILFFGGEPLLNHNIISFICDCFKEKATKGIFPLPVFSIITNGTICSQEIISLIRNHISCITVSIDGPQTINDENRVFPNGIGSYDKIALFINTCKQISQLHIQYEATYTMAHIMNHISKIDIQQHMDTTFGIKGFVVNEESLDPNIVLSELKSITKDTLISTNFECLPMDFWQITENVVCKKQHSFCGILHDRITISTKGDILPCQMLLGTKNNIVSNICDESATDLIKSCSHTFKDNILCKKCWCFKICGGCPITKFYSNNMRYNTLPDYKSCSLTRACVRECLSILYMIYTDDKLKPLFINKAKEKFL